MRKLQALKKERGDLEKVIPELVNAHGQHETARILGVSAATVNKWLKDNGYTLKQVYVKQEGSAA